MPAGIAGLILAVAAALDGPAVAEKPIVRAAPAAGPQRTLVTVIGAAGSTEAAEDFTRWADRWQSNARHGGLRVAGIGVGVSSSVSDREQLRDLLVREAATASDEFWLVLIADATPDGSLNLRGPDVSGRDLAEWLASSRGRVGIVSCARVGPPFVAALAAPGRVVITAAGDGPEPHDPALAEYLANMMAHRSADLDKDGQTSLLEAWLTAGRRAAEFNKAHGLPDAHPALLDDNGDGVAATPELFDGIRPRHDSDEPADGMAAHQLHLVRSPDDEPLRPEVRRRRDRLERSLDELRRQKNTLGAEDYSRRIEALLLELAQLYESSAPAELQSVSRRRSD